MLEILYKLKKIIMQTLRKKSSPCKYKNEPSRFLGDGVSFKAKLIGILEVSEARGDRMCQEALADLKMAIRAAGEHKQRITINIAIDGLRLRDEKTGDSLYHHPVHKISFIAQDMSDSRAFGYIFGSPDTGHRFFGIKTDKAASQVVIAMRDLFQVVFELKKKEIELAKQHIEQKSRFSSSAATSLFAADSAISSSKSYQNGSDSTSTKLASVSESSTSKHHTELASSRGASASVPPPPTTSNESAIADLVDLELELNSIQQGIHQMERITPSDPFGPGGKEDPFGNSDPFGDSFTSFPQKPFLPPPPSGGRDRTNRTTTTTTTSSDSNSLFSPKTPKTSGGSSEPISISSSMSTAHEASTTMTTTTTTTNNNNNNNLIKTTSSNDDQSSCDWFTPTGGTDSLFEDSLESVVKEADANEQNATAPAMTKNESNASILLLSSSQFDVFTELDPLGTGRSKPYIDKKLFFQELKNPPKKVLKDLLTEPGGGPTDTTNQFAHFETSNEQAGPFTTTTTHHQSSFLLQQQNDDDDPFAFGDPFDKTDPFGADQFPKEHDPFDTDFVVGDFKLFKDKAQTDDDHDDNDKYNVKPSPLHNSTKDKKKTVFQENNNNHKLQPLFLSPLSKSPNRNLDRQISLASSSSPRATTNAQLSKQNTFDSAKLTTTTQQHYDQKFSKLINHQLHENPSLDMSSESEVAPEPPPRPASNITPIKPPPLPPKKQPFDLSKKPPPRPPHTEESHYDYMESYETGLNSLDDHFDSPPLPVPARKSRFDSEFVPQRPKKQLPHHHHHHHSSDDDYLTPNPPKKDNLLTGPILLPPPQKPSKRGERSSSSQVVAAPETKPTPPEDTTLDITLSQLTLSGLNELAEKLKIPAAQLSNMTLVQLTNYLSNYVENSTTSSSSSHQEKERRNNEQATDATYPTFQADFSSNFNDLNQPTTKSEPYDRYAVFRELLQQDPPKTLEPEQDTPEPQEITVTTTTQEDTTNQADRYAALREIIIEENEVKEEEEDRNEEEEEEIEQKINNINQKIDEIELNVEPSSIIVELEVEKLKTPPKSPILLKSPPLLSPLPNLTKSPVPSAMTEIITQNNNLNHSGSVSDVISNSSPEIDNTVSKKNEENNTTTRESWAIFDTPNHHHHHNNRGAETKVQSAEEGVSPWSSDSKEFGNGSPSDWQQRRDSGSEGDWTRQRRRKDGTWWDNQGEIGGHYEKPPRATYPRERRSTDSYDDEWYEPDRPRRRTRPSGSSAGGGHTWKKSAGAGGGQSSSSRDVSPWEEEEQARTGPATSSVSGRREECWPPPPCTSRRSRGPSWDRHRRRDDSWDEEDDYEYENEYMSKFHWPERHGSSRDSDRASRDSDRHSGSREPPDHWDTGGGVEWNEDRRHMRRRGHPPDDRWCRPDWDHENDKVCGTKEKVRYGGGSRWAGTNNQDSGKWRGERERERKRDSDSRYYKRDHSQESPWEDDYSNDPDESPHSPRYLPPRRNWKRPSSASEMDRKSGENIMKQQRQAPYCVSAGGSDGERDRKYRTNRRSRSRDSQFSDIPPPPPHRHKIDSSLTLGRYRNRDKYNQMFDDKDGNNKLDAAKKSQTLGGRNKKTKELTQPPPPAAASPKIENDADKRKTAAQFKFENDFVHNSETDSPLTTKNKFHFENDFETSEAESPVNRYAKSPRNDFKRNVESSSSLIKPFHKNDLSDRESTSKSPITLKQTSLFEDDFSPTEKAADGGGGITAIAEEETEPRVTFTENNLDKSTPDTRKQKNLSKTRMGLCNIRADANLKKSESVNIFARENDPFDDDFFSGRENIEVQNVDNVIVVGVGVASPNVATDFKWTEDFDSFDMLEENNK